MIDIISELSTKFETELSNIKNSEELENIRVSYLGKKGSVTAAMKEMGKLSVEEKKEFGQKINILKNSVADKIAAKKEELAALELQREIDKVPEFDISLPEHFDQGSYHPITLVQRQCETIFKSGTVNGLGSLIGVMSRQAHMDAVYALLFLIIVIGILQDLMFKFIDKKLFSWKY